ncbi:hypothetical protein ACVGXU_09625, partial [Enterobacter hormaechei]
MKARNEISREVWWARRCVYETGIGLATAHAFIAEGARVAVTGRNPDSLAEAERILGDKAWVIPT